jgi:glycosyltransferase involved in cell wall biosynthesis
MSFGQVEGSHLADLEANKKPTVVLVFSHGIGLCTWHRAGFFAREIDYYRDVADSIGNVTFLTYDTVDPTASTEIPDVSPIQVVFNNRRVNYRLFGLLAPFLKYRALKSVDVIKTNQFFGSWTGLILKWVHRKPLLARCGYVWSLNVRRSGAGAVRNWMTRRVERFVLKRADAIAVPDQFALNYLSKLHDITSEKFTILPNFVDTDRFKPGDVSGRSKNTFLYVGRLSEEKRPALAVAAAGYVEDARLDVVGDGKEFENLRLTAEDLPNVVLLGSLPHSEVSEKMRSALGLVITSRYEGSPKAVIEAMASGLPVIAVKAPGLTEIVEDGVNGLLVDPEPEAIAVAMRSLIDDPKLWLKMSENGRQMAVDVYSKTSVLEKEISLLSRLIAS